MRTSRRLARTHIPGLVALRASSALALAIGLAACSVPAVSFTFVDGGPGAPDVAAPDVDSAMPDTTPLVRITVRHSGSAGGSVSAQGTDLSCADTCSASVPAGTSVTFVASPDTGAVFTGWSGGCTGTASCTLTVTDDIMVDARFDVAMLTVDVSLLGTGGGTVASTPAGLSCPDTCTLSVPYGTTLELAASPSDTATFLGWGGPCDGTGSCSFVVTADTTASATFGANQELTVSRTGNGTGTVSSVPAGISCGTDCAHRFPPGTVVTLSAAADATSTFAAWSGAGCTGTGTCQVTMVDAASVSARFTLQKRTLTVARAGTGSGTVTSAPAGISCGTDCTEPYDVGTVVTLTAAPAVASSFTGWSGAGCTGTSTCQVTMSSAASVTATFTAGTLFAVANFDSSSISVFPINASGNVAPLRRIAGTATQLVSPRGITVAGNEIIAVDQNASAVDVFDVNADGNVAPLRRIVGPSTGLNQPAGVLVFGGEIYVGQQGAGIVSVFPVNANGDVAPTRTITGFNQAEDLVITGGELYVTDFGNKRVAVFPVSASGAATPSRVLIGAATGLNGPIGLQIQNGEMIVANDIDGRIAVFPQFASDNVAPLRAMSGNNVGITQSLQIAVFGNEIYDPRYNLQSVDIFPLSGNGDIAPTRRIIGPATLLAGPTAVFPF